MKAIILDDELHCVNSLDTLLNQYTEVTVVAKFSNPLTAIKEMNRIQADILFIDIEMPHLNGFEVINIFKPHPWHVIFTTAYDEYAVKAFKVEAIDYLLKPIAKHDLIEAIEKCGRKNETNSVEKIPEPFVARMEKIAVPSLAGLELISAQDILYLESDSNYTSVYMLNQERIVVSKTLKSFEEMLQPFGFMRVHHSFIVNPNLIKRYVRGDGGYLIMENDQHINVSRARKEDLLRLINQGF